MRDKNHLGHISAMVTILIWGTTFISTKLLLTNFKPIEILFYRFVIGFLALLIVHPHRLRGTTKEQEGIFALAGLCGICFYYLLENIALTYTFASNVGVIISAAPFFTAILTHIFMEKEERLGKVFFIGFAVAMTGICLISFQGTGLHANPFGDLLALAAAFVWACYGVLTRKIGSFGYHTIQTTRRVFAYGIFCMLPAMAIFSFRPGLERFGEMAALGNMLFLGLGASAVCFVTWGIAVKHLGAVKTSVYIYLVPVITVAASALILEEQITMQTGLGTLLTLTGLVISEKGQKKKEEERDENGLEQ